MSSRKTPRRGTSVLNPKEAEQSTTPSRRTRTNSQTTASAQSHSVRTTKNRTSSTLTPAVATAEDDKSNLFKPTPRVTRSMSQALSPRTSISEDSVLPDPVTPSRGRKKTTTTKDCDGSSKLEAILEDPKTMESKEPSKIEDILDNPKTKENEDASKSEVFSDVPKPTEVVINEKTPRKKQKSVSPVNETEDQATSTAKSKPRLEMSPSRITRGMRRAGFATPSSAEKPTAKTVFTPVAEQAAEKNDVEPEAVIQEKSVDEPSDDDIVEIIPEKETTPLKKTPKRGSTRSTPTAKADQEMYSDDDIEVVFEAKTETLDGNEELGELHDCPEADKSQSKRTRKHEASLHVAVLKSSATPSLLRKKPWLLQTPNPCDDTVVSMEWDGTDSPAVAAQESENSEVEKIKTLPNSMLGDAALEESDDSMDKDEIEEMADSDERELPNLKIVMESSSDDAINEKESVVEPNVKQPENGTGAGDELLFSDDDDYFCPVTAGSAYSPADIVAHDVQKEAKEDEKSSQEVEPDDDANDTKITVLDVRFLVDDSDTEGRLQTTAIDAGDRDETSFDQLCEDFTQRGSDDSDNEDLSTSGDKQVEPIADDEDQEESDSPNGVEKVDENVDELGFGEPKGLPVSSNSSTCVNEEEFVDDLVVSCREKVEKTISDNDNTENVEPMKMQMDSVKSPEKMTIDEPNQEKQQVAGETEDGAEQKPKKKKKKRSVVYQEEEKAAYDIPTKEDQPMQEIQEEPMDPEDELQRKKKKKHRKTQDLDLHTTDQMEVEEFDEPNDEKEHKKKKKSKKDEAIEVEEVVVPAEVEEQNEEDVIEKKKKKSKKSKTAEPIEEEGVVVPVEIEEQKEDVFEKKKKKKKTSKHVEPIENEDVPVEAEDDKEEDGVEKRNLKTAERIEEDEFVVPAEAEEQKEVEECHRKNKNKKKRSKTDEPIDKEEVVYPAVVEEQKVEEGNDQHKKKKKKKDRVEIEQDSEVPVEPEIDFFEPVSDEPNENKENETSPSSERERKKLKKLKRKLAEAEKSDDNLCEDDKSQSQDQQETRKKTKKDKKKAKLDQELDKVIDEQSAAPVEALTEISDKDKKKKKKKTSETTTSVSDSSEKPATAVSGPGQDGPETPGALFIPDIRDFKQFFENVDKYSGELDRSIAALYAWNYGLDPHPNDFPPPFVSNHTEAVWSYIKNQNKRLNNYCRNKNVTLDELLGKKTLAGELDSSEKSDEDDVDENDDESDDEDDVELPKKGRRGEEDVDLFDLREDDLADLERELEAMEDEDDDEDDREDDDEDSEKGNDGKDKENEDKEYPKSAVDDQFFSLAEMNDRLDAMDRGEFGQDIFSTTEDKSGVATDICYEDFFGRRDAVKEVAKKSKKRKNDDGPTNVNIGKKKVRFALEDNDEDDENGEQNGGDVDEAVLRGDSVPDVKTSKFEKQQAKMRERVSKLEEENLKPRTWELSGEVAGDGRAENALLETHVEFDQNAKRAPEVTEDFTTKLEDLIKQRIKDKTFDDVVRSKKMEEKPASFHVQAIEETEGTKKSLSDVYEKEYQKISEQATTEKEKDEAHEKIRKRMQELFRLVDAMSHFEYAPPQAVEEVRIVSNMSSLRVEEVGMTASTDEQLLAPEEVTKKVKGVVKSEEERTKTDKLRARRKKKSKQRALVLKMGEDVAFGEQKAKKKAKKAKGQPEETQERIKSSNFFAKLQDTVQKEAKEKTKKKKIKSKKVDGSGAKFKL